MAKQRLIDPSPKHTTAKKQLVTFSVFGINVDMRTITPAMREHITALGFKDWPDAPATAIVETSVKEEPTE